MKDIYKMARKHKKKFDAYFHSAHWKDLYECQITVRNISVRLKPNFLCFLAIL